MKKTLKLAIAASVLTAPALADSPYIANSLSNMENPLYLPSAGELYSKVGFGVMYKVTDSNDAQKKLFHDGEKEFPIWRPTLELGYGITDRWTIHGQVGYTHNRDIERLPSSSSADSDENYCKPNVADLYIGKPNGKFLNKSDYDHGIDQGNTGAAWIYGNLSALNENFRLFREGDDEGSVDRLKGHDVMEFVRRDEETGGNSFSVFRVENGGGNGSSDTVDNSHARISLMNDFVQVFESGSGSSGTGNYEFMVGHSSLVGGESGFIHASMDGSTQVLELNTKQGLDSDNAAQLLTRINNSGGTVVINSGASTDTFMHTIINERGGRLTAGDEAGWLEATNSGNSSKVIILKNDPTVQEQTDKREFLVGVK